MVVPDPRVVALVAKSHISLAADFYWIRMASSAVQSNLPYQGAQLIRWGMLVTALDSQMYWAYVMGGMLGPVKVNDVAYNVDEAEALLLRGSLAMPDESRLGVYLSFLQLELKQNPAAAGETLLRTSKARNAPPFVAQLAARLLSQSGQYDRAREFAESLAQSGDPELTDFFARRALEIRRDELLAQIDRASEAFTQRVGRPPMSLEELVMSGLPPPEDPLGGTISLDAQGHAQTTSGARLKAFVPKESP